MLKYSKYILIVVCCAYVALFWCWAYSGFLTESQIQEAAKNTTNENSALHYSVGVLVIVWGILRWTGNHLLELGTIALASFVLVQIRDARKSSERQLRAYLSGFQARLTNFNAADTTVEIVIKNFGQTPAYQVRQISTVTFSSYPRIEPLELVQGKNAIIKNLGVVGPGAHFAIVTHLDHPPLSAQQKSFIGTKKAAIYAYGRIEYIDAFRRPRWAIYRYVFGGDEDPHPDGDLALCDEGNDAD